MRSFGGRVTHDDVKRVIRPKKRGQKKISFKPGGEHRSLGVPAGQKIPESKKRAARSGRYGVKAERQELFRENVLHGRK